ncbi:MAG: ABC transporter ATP-binding protein [Candidatus Marinimicrobia bacterium CG08_land_8_20_14_0_20_45_22]|nr:MAG: ABC transporter ATP-binding protein [Candidatus Marinimicrobia bacterium CG08_land_8_20_14_0_20_45_22]
MSNAIECANLTHRYGNKLVLNGLNFSIGKGRIFGLLGKNGMGKTTTINILMGFLRPTSGQCMVLGENSHSLSPKTRTRIGLLHEGHLAYDFMNVSQIEKFYAPFYPDWRKEFYYELIDKMGVSHDHKLSKMSCGQRSQVALGLILAQNPELMILDDYSMGLDAGYRVLFLDFLQAYVREYDKTVLITSHIIQDLEKIIDETLIIGRRKVLLQMSIREFMQTFHRYTFQSARPDLFIEPDEIIRNYENIRNQSTIYSFGSADDCQKYLKNHGVEYSEFQEISMTLEEAFIGLTGKY